MRPVLRSGAVVFGVLALIACGGAPNAEPARPSGQSGLMDKTFAGKDRCNAKDHTRPFVIEWDATDMSSFQARAEHDVIFVRYEGCNLQVLDSCADDSIKGSFGTYKPVDWTSGQLESIDISDEGDLYAKLPLGAATFGGKIRSGEKLHMEYFVTGQRTASRSSITRADIAKNPGCKGATHFVYGFNLGAFSIGSLSDLSATAGGSVYGFGAGGSKKTTTKIDKKGGDLASCKAETAKEEQTCRVPIRLTLRTIDEAEAANEEGGAGAGASASNAPVSKEATADKVDALERDNAAQRKTSAHYDTAKERWLAGDGKGCLTELDAGDKEAKADKSHDPRGLLQDRAICVMLAGQCDAGKKELRRSLEKRLDPNVDGSPEQIDKKVDEHVGKYCRGGKVAPRDQVLLAQKTLYRGAFETTLPASECAKAMETLKTHLPNVKPRSADDEVSFAASQALNYAPLCFARAGDCAKSKLSLREASHLKNPPIVTDSIADGMFDSVVPQCAGKSPGTPPAAAAPKKKPKKSP